MFCGNGGGEFQVEPVCYCTFNMSTTHLHMRCRHMTPRSNLPLKEYRLKETDPRMFMNP